MAGAQFVYDEKGNTFYFVIFCFYLVVLLPITYYCWPSTKKTKGKEDKERRCRCPPCLKKEDMKRRREPSQLYRTSLKIVFLIVAWVILALLAHKMTKIEIEHVEYDPYAILGLDKGAPINEIKKKYRDLTKTAHPDRGGAEEEFVKIAKAYAALTDEEARQNYATYGDPDGPGATTFGIALPKWLVSKEYGIYVLALYGIVFMFILPIAVGIWWYNSIKYTSDSVLIKTTKIHISQFNRTPSMNIDKIIQLLSLSIEFYNESTREMVNHEMGQVFKLLPMTFFDKKKKDSIYQTPYCVKARALFHAHLLRMHSVLEESSQLQDLYYKLQKSPLLIQDCIQAINHLNILRMQGHLKRAPTIESMDMVMKVSSMLVQALSKMRCPPLLQLPHFSEDMLRHCIKQRVRNCAELARLSETERRDVLINKARFSEEKYNDVITVLKLMPRIEIDAHPEVPGEEDKQYITARSYVRMRVTLKRHSLLDPAAALEAEQQQQQRKEESDDEEEKQEDKRKPWERPNKAKKKGPKMTAQQIAKQQIKQQQQKQLEEQKRKQKEVEERERKREEEKNDADSEDSNEAPDPNGKASCSDDESDADAEKNSSIDDDEETLHFDDELRRKNFALDSKSKATHLVHAPYFPEDKFEWWWVYMIDKKTRMLITLPQQVCTLVDEEVVDLRFMASDKKGNHTYRVVVKSDSYIDAEFSKDVKFEVYEARVVETHPQWQHLSESENEDGGKNIAADALGGDLSDGQHEDSESEANYTEDSENDD